MEDKEGTSNAGEHAPMASVVQQTPKLLDSIGKSSTHTDANDETCSFDTGAAIPAGKGKGTRGKGQAPKPPEGRGKSGKGSKGGKNRPLADEGDVALDLRQPALQPTRKMKALWWTKLNYGKQLKEGSTIWDSIRDLKLTIPTDVLEERFCKGVHPTMEKPAERKPEPQGPKELRITHDPQKIVGKEGALRSFPPVEAVVQALWELDHSVLTPQRLTSLLNHFCPLPHEVTQLEECRRENSSVPFAPPERYMWHISRVPAFRARIECWTFICHFQERAAAAAAAMAEFQHVEDALLGSKALPKLLALILQVGNYLNGGTKRGRADGFDLETLDKLDSVKDNLSATGSRDVRHFIFELFFLGTVFGEAVMAESEVQAACATGIELMQDLAPLFRNVNRTMMRDSEGSRKVVKNVRVVLEDVEQSVSELTAEFSAKFEALSDCLRYSGDPADPMKLVMVGQRR